jgi:murein DD-endopeptidase MepM/ murein hydrolase activator NlpD
MKVSQDLKYVAMSFLIILSVPVIAVFILTHAGINVVSDTLVHVSKKTKIIELFDPKGNIYKALQLDTNWPVVGRITLEFGQSDLPYQPFHTGIDIASYKGDNIIPLMKGTVIYAGEDFWGYGKHVIIDHGDNLTTLYAHLDRIFVVKGQKVTTGEVLGQEGETGWATGPHLHFEVRVFDIPVNPRKFLD